MVITIARNVRFDLKRGAGSALEILYGKVSLTPTLTHTVGTSVVLPAPSTFDLINGVAIATNVATTPAPVAGQIEWAYKVKIEDSYGKSFEYLVGVPDGTTEINFNVLPRYFETKPPLFGEGPQGVPGSAATITIGTTTSGPTPAVTNTGTSTAAVLNFTLAKGDIGPKGDGVAFVDTTFAALPSTYASGITIGNATTANGWPANFVSIITEKRYAGRTVQRLVDINNTTIQQRTEKSGDTWTPFKTVAWTDYEVIPALAATIGTESYPLGTSMFYNGTTDTGYPFIRGQVVTQRSAVNRATQIIYNTSVSAGTRALIRESDGLGGWGAFEEFAFKSYVDAAIASVVADPNTIMNGNEGIVYAARYGAAGATVGDGINNDYWTIQRAINDNKEILLEGGKDYLCAGTLSAPANGRGTISIRGTGAKPARLIVGASGQSYGAIKFEQTTPSATTTLNTPIGQNQHGWHVNSTAGILPGMICEVVSDKLWYFDPRPGEGQAQKSELHKVRDTFAGKVYFEDPSFDGYTTSGETVTLSFYVPIKVYLENIEVVGKLPAPGEETGAMIGIEIQHADNPQLINVSTDSCARTGVYFNKCYRPYIQGGTSKRSNNFWNGYGVSVSGSTHGLVKDRIGYECRRNIDISGANVVSRMTTIQNCTAVGGGYNSRGIEYGWSEDTGALRADQYGFGSHGPADQSRYINCTTLGIMRPYSLRGRDEVIINPRHVGRTHGGVIQLGYGTNLFVEGGVATGGTWSYKDGSPYISGQSQAYWRPDNFIRMYPSYQVNPVGSTQRGRIVIKGVTAEVKDRFMWIYPQVPSEVPLGVFVLADLDVQFWPEVGSDDCYLIWGEGTVDAGIGKNRWFIGPNRLTQDSGTGTIRINNSPAIKITGANVLNYTVSP